MKRTLCSTLLLTLMLWVMLCAGGCAVHEFPADDTPVQIDLEFKFNTAFLPFKDVDYTKQEEASSVGCVMRYQVRAYPMAEDGSVSEEALKQFTFTKSALTQPDYTVTIELPEGKYLLRSWFDYVTATSQQDNFYKTSDFENITLTEPYTGDTDYKDAFFGICEVVSIRAAKDTPNAHYTLDMERPLSKFQFIAVDFEEFVTKIMQEKLSPEEYQEYINNKNAGKTDRIETDYTVEISDTDKTATGTGKAPWDPTKNPGFEPESYKIVFQYTSYVPNTYDLFRRKPIDAFFGYKFSAVMLPLNQEEARIGMDYILINGDESSVSLKVLLYSPEGELLSTSNSVIVPIVRGKVTTIRGKFLTLKIDGGISVDTDFDGDINIII